MYTYPSNTTSIHNAHIRRIKVCPISIHAMLMEIHGVSTSLDH